MSRLLAVTVFCAGAAPACGGCCQESADNIKAITYNMETCQRSAAKMNEGANSAKLDPTAELWTNNMEIACMSSPENVGCCRIGPPGACNWSRDCCNRTVEAVAAEKHMPQRNHQSKHVHVNALYVQV